MKVTIHFEDRPNENFRYAQETAVVPENDEFSVTLDNDRGTERFDLSTIVQITHYE